MLLLHVCICITDYICCCFMHICHTTRAPIYNHTYTTHNIYIHKCITANLPTTLETFAPPSHDAGTISTHLSSIQTITRVHYIYGCVCIKIFIIVCVCVYVCKIFKYIVIHLLCRDTTPTSSSNCSRRTGGFVLPWRMSVLNFVQVNNRYTYMHI